MPPSSFNDGGGALWDDENDPLTTDQSWLPLTSVSDSSSAFDSNVEAQSQNTGVSVRGVVDHSGTARNAFLATSQHFTFDFHQVQSWPAVPVLEQVRASAGVPSVIAGGDWRSSFDSRSSPLGNTNIREDTFRRPIGGPTARRNQTTSSSQISLIKSIASRSSPLSTDAEAPRSVPSENNASRSASKHSKATSMNSSSVRTLIPGQVTSNSRSLPGTSQLNTTKKMHTGTRTLEVDEDSRSGQAGQYTRGGSLVSSTSGFSRGDIGLPKFEVADEETSRQSLTQENRGAGRTPGVLRTEQGNDATNGQFALPPGKGFPIQIGSELFRLSGASIMSDGQYYLQRTMEERFMLRVLEHPHTSQDFSRNSFDRTKMVPGA